MFGECHAHIIMDGVNYKEAISLHKERVNDAVIRAHLQAYQKLGIRFVRDGGDALGVSKRAKEFAEEYEIDYRTPVFAIHKNGHYGAIVGNGFDTMTEYYDLVKKAKAEGADFIKIMTTGLLDFNDHGKVTGTPLDAAEVREMVHIAHEEGMAVMSHTNGVYGVQAAVAAGVDSVEHGNYINEETIEMLAGSDTIWVPTLVTVRNLQGCGRYEDKVLRPIIEAAERNLKLAYEKKVKVALGSDAGAYKVLHGKGLKEEYQAFLQILSGDISNHSSASSQINTWLEAGEREIRKKFIHPQS